MSGGWLLPPSFWGERGKVIKHKEIWVNLEGKSDRLAIIGTVAHAMRHTALPEGEVEEFREEAHKTKTLDDLFAVCEQWVRVTR